MYCAQKQNTFQAVHHLCVPCTETQHFPDDTQKALLTDYKTTFKNKTRPFTIIHVYQHMQLTQIKSHTKATHRMYKLMYDFQFMLCAYVGITNDGLNASND